MHDDRAVSGRRVRGVRRMRRHWIVALASLGATLVVLPAPAGGSPATAPATRHATSARRHATSARRQSTGSIARATPFSGRGMWIWDISASSGGNLGSIVSTAHRYGISTLTIKAGDGSGTWSQFNSKLVRTLHANGLHVCAWQYVYGNDPVQEAQVGAAAVHAGADCLAIDAESEYEGKYIQAQTYMSRLRTLIGNNFPVALASFPYVDLHPGFPYSVFLGPGGAQYNTPQMYWIDIGTSVDAVYAHTFGYNGLYGRAIVPLGQVYNSPPLRQIVRFRMMSRSYAARGVSWWNWQEASASGWRALSQPAGWIAGYTASRGVPLLGQGALGDLVVSAQERLVSAGYSIPVDGGFGLQTVTAVASFQLAHGLSVDGIVGPATWQALLRYGPARVQWTSAGARTARAAGLGLTMRLPKSAKLRAKRNEIPGSLGAGAPKH